MSAEPKKGDLIEIVRSCDVCAGEVGWWEDGAPRALDGKIATLQSGDIGLVYTRQEKTREKKSYAWTGVIMAGQLVWLMDSKILGNSNPKYYKVIS
jgi:hypothetical protein